MDHRPNASVNEAAGDSNGLDEAFTYRRRLSDKILLAFHHACDEHDLAVATALLQTLEVLISRLSATGRGSRRRSIESLVGAHCRLWDLKRQGRPGTVSSADMFTTLDKAGPLLS
jgi:hypothetical protein